MGGDWFGLQYDPTTHRLYLAIADVSGHGTKSSIVTLAISGVFSGGVSNLSKNIHRHQALRQLEASLDQCTQVAAEVVDRSMTMALICIDLKSKAASYINRGHPPIAHIGLDRTRWILEPGSLLGKPQDHKSKILDLQLDQGDLLFLYTDGVLENCGSKERRATRDVRKALSAESRRNPLTTHQTLGTIYDQHKENQNDDATHLIMKVS